MQSCAARATTRAALATANRPRSLLLTGGAPFGRAARRFAGNPKTTVAAAATTTTDVAATAAAAAAPATPTTPLLPLPTPTSAGNPDWTIRMLYDGECALCMKEVEFLRKRDARRGRIDFVDIASPSYSAELNCGIDYERAMAKIHAIRRDGEVLTGVRVFRELYEAVDLGWVYSATANPAVERVANGVYDFWAKWRTQITGREDMATIFDARRRRLAAAGAGEALPGSECGIDGSGCGGGDQAAAAAK